MLRGLLLALVATATVVTTAPDQVAAAPVVTRVAGTNRYETAAAVGTEYFPAGVATAYVATGVDYPDALAAGVAAATEDAPVLLTAPTALPTATARALSALRPGRIVVVGGANAVSEGVLQQLRAYTTGGVVRIAGSDRFDTAARLSRSRFPSAATVFVATGRNFADALAAAPAAAASNAPLLLLDAARIPAPTAAELTRLNPGRIVVLGGPGAVSAAVVDQLRLIGTVQRVAGADRYGTASAVAAYLFPASTATVFIATGASFPDALAAGAAGARLGAPVLLASPTCLSPEATMQITRLNPSSAVLLGGGGALSPSVGQLATCPPGARYLGQGPIDAIRAQAARVAAQYQAAGCSTIDGDRLAAMMISPIFKESGAATTPATAPSPMTLSRYDEWNGTTADTNAGGNRGLYAFRDPLTPYVRAYWHPGIGMWQYDSAGVGAPYTAVERMDVNIVGADVATGMASRYCAAPGTGGQPPTEQERRDRAWQPWWSAGGQQRCPLCQREYAALMLPPVLGVVQPVAGITATGGVSAPRQCRLPGATTTVTCWYVDPNTAQGNRWWVTLNPLGTPSVTVAPTPLSLPFYVVKRNNQEERYWLPEDTGYDMLISAARVLGQNARIRGVASGLTWRPMSGLCDVTANRGTCTVAVTAAVERPATTVTPTTAPAATAAPTAAPPTTAPAATPLPIPAASSPP